MSFSDDVDDDADENEHLSQDYYDEQCDDFEHAPTCSGIASKT